MTTRPTADAVDEAPRTLAELRQRAQMTSAQVAKKMGVNEQRVRHIEAAYPNLNYGTLTRYIAAIGGGIQFTVGTTHVHADQLSVDTSKTGTRKYLKDRTGRGGNLVYQPTSAAAEELPLQGDAAHTGGDDTGRQVDHPDTEGDQADGDQRQQP